MYSRHVDTTIALIDDEDIQYFEEEVKSGKVSAFFESVDGINVLDGSMKTVENFEFTRGHKKFLLKIRDVVKTSLENDGTKSTFSTKQNKPEAVKRKITDKTKSSTIPQKKFKCCSTDLSRADRDLPSSIDVPFSMEDMKKERNVLLGKVISSLIRHTPEMYVAARIKVLFMANELRPFFYTFTAEYVANTALDMATLFTIFLLTLTRFRT